MILLLVVPEDQSIELEIILESCQHMKLRCRKRKTTTGLGKQANLYQPHTTPNVPQSNPEQCHVCRQGTSKTKYSEDQKRDMIRNVKLPISHVLFPPKNKHADTLMQSQLPTYMLPFRPLSPQHCSSESIVSRHRTVCRERVRCAQPLSCMNGRLVVSRCADMLR